jgi:hypothetical protein
MAVLLRLENGQGVCDKRCYDATEERCCCRVCGGLMHGIGQEKALAERTKVLKLLDQHEAIGEAQPHRIDSKKRRQREKVVVLERRIAPTIVHRLRAPVRIQAQIDAGQLPLWRGAERVAPIRRLARPRVIARPGSRA